MIGNLLKGNGKACTSVTSVPQSSKMVVNFLTKSARSWYPPPDWVPLAAEPGCFLGRRLAHERTVRDNGNSGSLGEACW